MNSKLMDPEDAMSGPEACPAVAEGLLMGRGEGTQVEHEESQAEASSTLSRALLSHLHLTIIL